MTLKVAKMTKYGRLAASTRQRFDQYDEYLQSKDLETESWPLLDDEYLDNLYNSQRRSTLHVAKRYLKRFARLMRPGDVDLIWVHCEVFPYLPNPFEQLVKAPRKPIVFDFDDAIFHQYDQHPRVLVRTLLGKKLAPVIEAADTVFCGNAYLQDYAAKYNHNTQIVPTVLDTTVYLPAECPKTNEQPSIGWIGTPATWESYMEPMMPLLSDVAAHHNARVTSVGAGRAATAHPSLDLLPWSEAAEVSQLQNMDIGVMPLDDTPWSHGKCGYKLIQFMACGLPVIASPVGVNASIVEHGVNGFLAESPNEWREALNTLLGDADLRRRMGGAGRKRVEEQYSLSVWGPKVAQMLLEAAQRG
jgi:glycosyltransferase involved in cell wall biosynthesis